MVGAAAAAAAAAGALAAGGSEGLRLLHSEWSLDNPEQNRAETRGWVGGAGGGIGIGRGVVSKKRHGDLFLPFFPGHFFLHFFLQRAATSSNANNFFFASFNTTPHLSLSQK